MQETTSDQTGATINVNGKLSVTSGKTGLWVYEAGQGASTAPKFEVTAADIGIRFADDVDGITSTSSLSVTATTGNIVVSSEGTQGGIEVKNKGSNGAKKTFNLSAVNGFISVKANDSIALLAQAGQGAGVQTSVSLTARDVTLQGGSMSATLWAHAPGEINFSANTVSLAGGSSALNANAGIVSFKPLTEGGTTEVALKGNTTVTGPTVLNGKTAAVSALSGSDVSFVIGDLTADKLTINSNKVSGLNVAATGELNDQFGNPQAAA